MKRITTAIQVVILSVMIVQLSVGAGFFEQGTAPTELYQLTPIFNQARMDSTTGKGNTSGRKGPIAHPVGALSTLNGGATLDKLLDGSYSIVPKVADFITRGGPYVDVRAYGAKLDGITNDRAAVIAAWNTIKDTGGTLFVPGWAYIGSVGLDFSKSTSDYIHSYNLVGIGDRQSGFKSENAAIVLDLGGRNHVNIRDFGIWDKGKTSKVGIARYRTNSGDGDGHFHNYTNFSITGAFSVAGLYSVGSEVNIHINPRIIITGTGSGYASSNAASAFGLTGTALPIKGGSNTVNNFYGGSIWGQSSNPTVTLTGIIQNTNFDGVYLVSSPRGNVVVLGSASSPAQGGPTFNGVRFEGYDNAVMVYSGDVMKLQIINTLFGQLDATGVGGYDIAMVAGASGNGMTEAYIAGNTHSAKGIIIGTNITDSYIQMQSRVLLRTGGIKITGSGMVSGTYIEAPTITMSTASISGPGNVLITKSDHYHRRVYYGPGTSNPVYGSYISWGSTVVNKPFGMAPDNVEAGLSVTADGAYWRAAGITVSQNYPVFYDGNNWHAMIPLPYTPAHSTSTCKKSTIAFDRNYIYICVADNTWRRFPTSAW